eukprot:TRINITY_DN1080_c6_g1_i1.p1 TRINITY_DN1080_c6_g1~~TRINITY_DN1080_c6_g1_i1.p1  ORF type:complete len:547 (+),score=122.36 TRINITY_DN1080_c6_g1_i1:150-1790(+)
MPGASRARRAPNRYVDPTAIIPGSRLLSGPRWKHWLYFLFVVGVIYFLVTTSDRVFYSGVDSPSSKLWSEFEVNLDAATTSLASVLPPYQEGSSAAADTQNRERAVTVTICDRLHTSLLRSWSNRIVSFSHKHMLVITYSQHVCDVHGWGTASNNEDGSRDSSPQRPSPSSPFVQCVATHALTSETLGLLRYAAITSLVSRNVSALYSDLDVFLWRDPFDVLLYRRPALTGSSSSSFTEEQAIEYEKKLSYQLDVVRWSSVRGRTPPYSSLYHSDILFSSFSVHPRLNACFFFTRANPRTLIAFSRLIQYYLQYHESLRSHRSYLSQQSTPLAMSTVFSLNPDSLPVPTSQEANAPSSRSSFSTSSSSSFSSSSSSSYFDSWSDSLPQPLPSLTSALEYLEKIDVCAEDMLLDALLDNYYMIPNHSTQLLTLQHALQPLLLQYTKLPPSLFATHAPFGGLDANVNINSIRTMYVFDREHRVGHQRLTGLYSNHIFESLPPTQTGVCRLSNLQPRLPLLRSFLDHDEESSDESHSRESIDCRDLVSM